MAHELAIIRDINVGMRDCGKPVVWFTVEILRGSALMIEYDVAKFIEDADCNKLSDLNDKPCIVDTSNAHKVVFVKMKD